MKKSIIFSENQDFAEDKINLKKSSLKEILNSEDFVLKLFIEEGNLVGKLKKSGFTSVYSSSSS